MSLYDPPRVRNAGILRATLLAAAITTWLIMSGAPPRVEAAPAGQNGGPGETLFQAKCVACHTIGKGRLVGPDLQGVTVRREPAWLKRFIGDPNTLFAANDPTAQQLLAESNGVKMPALGLSDVEVDALIAFLGGKATAAGASAPTAPAAASVGDPTAGRRVFTGEARLSAAGPACISCHSVGDLSGLGGGALGPDLTHAAQRYPGPGLSAVLANIAFPTMVGPFANQPLTSQEQANLVAYLVDADKKQTPVPAIAAGSFTANAVRLLVVGLAGALVLIVVMAIFWPRQRQSASARLRSSHKSGLEWRS